jgi:hypothetical protein
MSNKNNPVLKTVHGVKIRRYNYPQVMFNEEAFEKLIEQSHDTGLSIPKIIAHKSLPCQKCGCDNITIVLEKDGKINKQDTGTNIIEKNAQRH